MAAGFFWLTFLTADKPVIWIMVGMFLIGLGLGQLMQTLTIASQNSVGPRDMGVATSSSTFFRQIGGTLGVAVLFSVLFGRIPETIASAFGTRRVTEGIAAAITDPEVLADPANTQILKLYQRGQNGGSLGTSFLNGSDPRLAAPFLEGFSNATVTIYWVALAVVLVAFVLSFFLKATPLREKSALQENSDNEAALAAQLAAAETGALVTPDVAFDDSAPRSPAPRKK
jgi:hypothetical protein